MNQPQFHPKARAEFEKSALFYHEKFPGLGLEFAAEVQAAVAFAFTHPEVGAPAAEGFRPESSSADSPTQSYIAAKATVSSSLR